MSYCLTLGCSHPENPDLAEYCQSCGASLLLQNRYRVLNILSRGGFGRTFLAVDQQIPSQPSCVVKQFFFQDENAGSYTTATRLFRQEAVRLDQLGKHPQIPQLLAYFEQNQQLFIIQEYIEGKTLFDEFKTDGSFNEEKIWQILKEILPILDFIHRHNIIHRDIKPANIMRRLIMPSSNVDSASSHPLPVIAPETQVPATLLMGEQEQAHISAKIKQSISTCSISPSIEVQAINKLDPDQPVNQIILIDFGGAKLLTGAGLVGNGTIIGTPEFMAPEQTRGKVYPASDLYSLGATCLYLLTGISPWKLYNDNQDEWEWKQYLKPHQEISSKLQQILDRLVEHKLNQRYQSAEEILQEIKRFELTQPRADQTSVPKNISNSQKAKKANLTLPKQSNHPKGLITKIKQTFFREKLNDELKSSVGADYTQLQQLLAQKRWKKADEETWLLLCQMLGKSGKSFLHYKDLEKLPCQDLITLDQLWVKYSQGRFGLSIQVKIYQQANSDYGKFCQKVGWLTYNPSNPNIGITYKSSALVGHLPSRNWIIANGRWWQHLDILSEKFVQCRLE